MRVSVLSTTKSIGVWSAPHIHTLLWTPVLSDHLLTSGKDVDIFNSEIFRYLWHSLYSA